MCKLSQDIYLFPCNIFLFFSIPDVTVKLPSHIKSSKELKVTINPSDICVVCRNGDTIIKDSLPYKIKAIDSFWSISEGKLLMHLGSNLDLFFVENLPSTII